MYKCIDFSPNIRPSFDLIFHQIKRLRKEISTVKAATTTATHSKNASSVLWNSKSWSYHHRKAKVSFLETISQCSTRKQRILLFTLLLILLAGIIGGVAGYFANRVKQSNANTNGVAASDIYNNNSTTSPSLSSISLPETSAKMARTTNITTTTTTITMTKVWAPVGGHTSLPGFISRCIPSSLEVYCDFNDAEEYISGKKYDGALKVVSS